MHTKKTKFKLVVIGVSAGGLETLNKLFARLDKEFNLPIIVVQHISPDQEFDFLMKHYSDISKHYVKEVEEKESIKNGVIYFAPPNYHVLVEDNYTLSLSVEEKVNYSRPSVDILFLSAAYTYFSNLLAIVLTGANGDGSNGALEIKENGGYVIAQKPEEALYPVMPQATINKVKVDAVMTIEKIADFLNKQVKR
jgi:two-component system, chemotaxis family, protein-glutamate methylesterase/glutaminase